MSRLKGALPDTSFSIIRAATLKRAMKRLAKAAHKYSSSTVAATRIQVRHLIYIESQGSWQKHSTTGIVQVRVRAFRATHLKSSKVVVLVLAHLPRNYMFFNVSCRAARQGDHQKTDSANVLMCYCLYAGKACEQASDVLCPVH